MPEEQKTVREWLERSGASYGEYPELFDAHGDKLVAQEFSSVDEETWKPFPQPSFTHRRVFSWLLLEDGSAIGHNESDRAGWSFPRVGAKTVARVYPPKSEA